MKKIFYLSTCSTCKKILEQIPNLNDFSLQDIKTEAITEEQIDFLKEAAGSYEDLFSRRAMKYRALGLHEKNLKEEDYRSLILEEYTFLKRPVIVIEDQVFVGSSKKMMVAVLAALQA